MMPKLKEKQIEFLKWVLHNCKGENFIDEVYAEEGEFPVEYTNDVFYTISHTNNNDIYYSVNIADLVSKVLSDGEYHLKVRVVLNRVKEIYSSRYKNHLNKSKEMNDLKELEDTLEQLLNK